MMCGCIRHICAATLLFLITHSGAFALRNGGGESPEKEIMVESKFAASNMIYVTVKRSFPVAEQVKVSAYFVLHEGSRTLDHKAVSHESSYHLTATTLRYSLWLSRECFSTHVQIQTHLNFDSKYSSLKSTDIVHRLPDMRPPRISHLLWHNSSSPPGGIQLCSRLNCTTPPPPIYVIDGDRVSLSCVIDQQTTSRPIHIQWLRNGVVIKNISYNQSGDVIDTVQVVSNADSVYQCKAKTNYGLSASHEITVYEIDFNPPNVQQKSLFKEKGSSVKLDCNVSSVTSRTPPGTVLVTWYRDDSYVEPGPRYVMIDEAGILVIRDLELSDAGQYACTIENIELGNEKTIGIAELHVTDVSVENNEVLELYGQPEHIEPLVGSPLTLYCIFSSSENVIWTNLGSIEAHSISNYNTALHIPRVSKALDQQRINCRTQSNSARKSFEISVQEKPVISQSSNIQAVTVGEKVEIECDVNLNPKPEILWYSNEKQLSLTGSRIEWSDVGKNINGEVLCKVATRWGVTMAATSIFVYDRTVILEKGVEPKGGRIQLHCVAQTDNNTPLNITWYAVRLTDSVVLTLNDVIKDDSPVNDIAKEDIRIANDTLTVPGYMVNGYNFTCEATNGYSTAKQTFEDLKKYAPTAQPSSSNILQSKSSWKELSPLFILVGAASTIVFLAIILGVSTYKCYAVYRVSKRSNKSDTASLRLDSRLNSYHSDTSQVSERLLQRALSNRGHQGPLIDVNSNAQKVRKSSCLANDPDLMTYVMEVFLDRSRIDVQEIIGKGQFGRVYKGILLNEKGLNCGPIAIKTLKYKSNETEMVDLFLREAVIMKNFQHQNVLSLIGISVDADDSPMVVLPYMSRGDLRGYVLNQDIEITVLDLLKLGLQVARGMAYLCSQKFVHRDLACRNCMVDDNICVKVADFGLSRDLFSRDYYRDSPGKHPLPVRWMAPECHKKNVFTMQSDVWSFGVLLWELMTRGLTPYYEVENWQVPAHVMSGATLAQPEYCPDSVFEVMVGCWYVEPQARSAFPEIVQQIEDIILTARNGTTYDSDRFYHNIQRPEATDYRECTSMPTTPV